MKPLRSLLLLIFCPFGDWIIAQSPKRDFWDLLHCRKTEMLLQCSSHRGKNSNLLYMR